MRKFVAPQKYFVPNFALQTCHLKNCRSQNRNRVHPKHGHGLQNGSELGVPGVGHTLGVPKPGCFKPGPGYLHILSFCVLLCSFAPFCALLRSFVGHFSMGGPKWGVRFSL